MTLQRKSLHHAQRLAGEKIIANIRIVVHGEHLGYNVLENGELKPKQAHIMTLNESRK
jgi:hypothetical protein